MAVGAAEHGTVPMAWVAREPPLAPCAVVALGDAARALGRRVLARDDAALATLRGVAAPGLIALLGAEHDLPWVDGVAYLGRDPDAPALLLPTALRPTLPPALLERALLAGGADTPFAVLAEPARSFSLAAARPVSRARLRAWLGSAP